MAGNAVLSTRGLLSDPNPSCLTAKVPQVKLVYREANPLPLYCTWPRTTEGCFGRWVWSAWTPRLLLRAAASQEHLSWASSLWDAREHQGFPCDMGHLSFPQTWPKIWARWLHCVCEEHTCSQGILKYSVCVETGSIGSALWSIHMVVFFFSMPGGAFSSIDDFLEPPNWWVSLIKVCCSWASILLSYPAAMVGKAGFAPSCLCWYCLLFAICVISPLAFFPLCKWRVLSLDI